MSDDEYYVDSPYDEFEEMLWDADPGSNLADDLAQHACFSPIWQDDPIGELDTYHSDWEYYSDDYWDDDPGILRNNPADGGSRSAKDKGTAPNKRGRKRKLGETDSSVDLVAIQSLKNTIQGTVWAKEIVPRTAIFKSGQHEKVALLTDWRKKFQTDREKSRLLGKTKLNRDESWANELSLADMGLIRVLEKAEAKQDVEAQENELVIGEDEVSREDWMESCESFSQNESDLQLSEKAMVRRSKLRKLTGDQAAYPQMDSLDDEQSQDHDNNSVLGLRKKRRKIDLPSPPQSHTSIAKSSGTSIVKASDTVHADDELQLRISEDDLLPLERSPTGNEITGPRIRTQRAVTQKRKRRHSSSSGVMQETETSQTHARAKRLASDKRKDDVTNTTLEGTPSRKIRRRRGSNQ